MGIEYKEVALDSVFNFTSLIYGEEVAQLIVDEVGNVTPQECSVKDILRACNIPVIDDDHPSLDRMYKKIDKGKAMRPVVIVRGTPTGTLLADGLHKCLALNALDNKTPVLTYILDFDKLGEEDVQTDDD